MKLMTKEIESKIPALYAQEKLGDKAMVHVKFFGLWGLDGWRWYATEFRPEEGLFFGLVTSPMCPEGELGYFSLKELQSAGCVERDLYFPTTTLEEIRKHINETGYYW